jgi:hypothetical protein
MKKLFFRFRIISNWMLNIRFLEAKLFVNTLGQSIPRYFGSIHTQKLWPKHLWEAIFYCVLINFGILFCPFNEITEMRLMVHYAFCMMLQEFQVHKLALLKKHGMLLNYLLNYSLYLNAIFIFVHDFDPAVQYLFTLIPCSH